MAVQSNPQLRQMNLRHFAQPHPELRHVRSAQAIPAVFAVAPTFDQTGRAERLQMALASFRSMASAEASIATVFTSLGEQLQQFQPLGARQRLADAGDLFVERVFQGACCHGETI